MVNLTRATFPGFFRARTNRLGNYFGIRGERGELIAKAGEPFSCGRYREISAVCTHPSTRGRGLASALNVASDRAASCVGSRVVAPCRGDNATAIRLYRSMGLVEHATIRATCVARVRD
jgi:predicted GNAT family acetyltransferase